MMLTSSALYASPVRNCPRRPRFLKLKSVFTIKKEEHFEQEIPKIDSIESGVISKPVAREQPLSYCVKENLLGGLSHKAQALCYAYKITKTSKNQKQTAGRLVLGRHVTI